MKKTWLVVVCVLLCLVFSACGNILKKEYISLEAVVDQGLGEDSDEILSVSSYDQLKSGIKKIVQMHEEVYKIKFIDYEGDLQSDLAQAVNELSSQDMYVAYAVDYISTELSRIVSYYEAKVYVNYRKTQEEIDKIVYIAAAGDISDSVLEVMENFGQSFVCQVANIDLNESLVLKEIKEAFNTDSSSCIIMPKVEVSLYPATGIQKIIEIKLSYQQNISLLKVLRSHVYSAMKDLKPSDELGELDKILGLYTNLINSCTFDENNSKRVLGDLDILYGSTIYGALCEGMADSLGMALGFNSLCKQNGIESILVEGLKNKEVFYWNIVQYKGVYYHIDTASGSLAGVKNSLMENDDLMQDLGYWWNIEDYPECNGDLNIE